jgi:hypothetical protein
MLWKRQVFNMETTTTYAVPFSSPIPYSLSMETSPQLDQLASDLSKLQGELPHVGKDSKGYGYNYSSLASTLDVLKPLLVKFGFSISQFGGPDDTLITLLLHKSGQFIRGSMKIIDIEMKGTNAAQNRGAVLSYFKRYGIQAIVGMASEDSDGAVKPVDKVSASPAKESVVISDAKENKPQVEAPARRSFRTGPTQGKSEAL